MKIDSGFIIRNVFFLILTIYTLSRLIYTISIYIKFKRANLKKCVGQIEAFEGRRHRGIPGFIYSYSYTVNEKNYKNGKYKTLNVFDKGDKIETYYIEENPKESIVEEEYNFFLLKIFGNFLALLFYVTFWALIIYIQITYNR